MTQLESDRKTKNTAPEEPTSLTADVITPAPSTTKVESPSVSAGDQKASATTDTAPEPYSSSLRDQMDHASQRFTDELVSKPAKKRDEEIAAVQSSSVAQTVENQKVDIKPAVERTLLRSASLQEQEAIINKLLEPTNLAKITGTDKIEKKAALIEPAGEKPLGKAHIDKSIETTNIDKSITALPTVSEKLDPSLKQIKYEGKPTLGSLADQISSEAKGVKHSDNNSAPQVREGIFKNTIEEHKSPSGSSADARYKVEPINDGNLMISKGVRTEPNVLKTDGVNARPESFTSSSVDLSVGKFASKLGEASDFDSTKPAKIAAMQESELVKRGTGEGYQTKSLSSDHIRQLDYNPQADYQGKPSAIIKQIEPGPLPYKDPGVNRIDKIAMAGESPRINEGTQVKSVSFDTNARQFDNLPTSDFARLPNVIHPRQFEPNALPYKDPLTANKIEGLKIGSPGGSYEGGTLANLAKASPESFPTHIENRQPLSGSQIGKMLGSEGFVQKSELKQIMAAETRPYPVENMKDFMKSQGDLSRFDQRSMPNGTAAKSLEYSYGQDISTLTKKAFETGVPKGSESGAHRGSINSIGSSELINKLGMNGGTEIQTGKSSLINSIAAADGKQLSGLDGNIKHNISSTVADGRIQNLDGFKSDLKTFAAQNGKYGQDIPGKLGQEISKDTGIGKVLSGNSMPIDSSTSMADKIAAIKAQPGMGVQDLKDLKSSLGDGGVRTQPAMSQDLRNSLNGSLSAKAEKLTGDAGATNTKVDGVVSKPSELGGRNPAVVGNTATPIDSIKPTDLANRGTAPIDSIRSVPSSPSAQTPLIGRDTSTSPVDSTRPATPSDGRTATPSDTRAGTPPVKPGSGVSETAKPAATETVKPATTETVKPGSAATPGVRPTEAPRSPLTSGTVADASAIKQRTPGTSSPEPVGPKPAEVPTRPGTMHPDAVTARQLSDANAGKLQTPIKLASALDPVSAFEQSSQRIRQLAETRASETAGRNPFESRNPFETRLSGLITRDFGTESGGARISEAGKNIIRLDGDGRTPDSKQSVADAIRGGNSGAGRNVAFGNVEGPAGRRVGEPVGQAREPQITSFDTQGKSNVVRIDPSGKEMPGKVDVGTSGIAAGIGRIPVSGSVRVADFQPVREIGQTPVGTGADIRTVGDVARVPGMRGFAQINDGRTFTVQGDVRAPRGETNRYITGLELALILSIAGIAKLRGDARTAGARLEGRTWSIGRENGKPIIFVDGRQNPFQVQKAFGKGDGRGSFRIMISTSGDQAAKLSTRTMRTADVAKSQAPDTGRGLNLGLVGRLTYLNSFGKPGAMNYYSQFKSTSYTGGMGLAFVMAASGMTRGSMMPNEIQGADKLNSKLSGPADRVKFVQSQNSLITQFGRFNLDAGKSEGDARREDQMKDSSTQALDDYQAFLSRLDNFSKREDEEDDDEAFIVNRAIRFETEALYEEASEDDEEVVGEIDEDDTKNGALSQVLRRPKWVIESGQTLDGIAERLFGSADLGWLIADLNRNLIRETYIDNKRIVELNSRQEIELPVYQDIQKFNQARKKTWNAENLVTIVVERQIDREAVEQVLRKVVGA